MALVTFIGGLLGSALDDSVVAAYGIATGSCQPPPARACGVVDLPRMVGGLERGAFSVASERFLEDQSTPGVFPGRRPAGSAVVPLGAGIRPDRKCRRVLAGVSQGAARRVQQSAADTLPLVTDGD